ncbi:hypothetical protein CCP1ISM_10044 [Azospirillaceae bacterium]
MPTAFRKPWSGIPNPPENVQATTRESGFFRILFAHNIWRFVQSPQSGRIRVGRSVRAMYERPLCR